MWLHSRLGLFAFLLGYLLGFLLVEGTRVGIPCQREVPFGPALNGLGIVVDLLWLPVGVVIARVPLAVLVFVENHSHVVFARLEVEELRLPVVGRCFLDHLVRSVEQLCDDRLPLHALQGHEERGVLVERPDAHPLLDGYRGLSVDGLEGGAVDLQAVFHFGFPCRLEHEGLRVFSVYAVWLGVP